MMDKKKRLRGIMAGLFCIGVLTGGVGTGVAFADFSTFTYHQLPEPKETLKQEVFTVQLGKKEGPVWLSPYLGNTACVIEETEEISRGTVEILVDYDGEWCTPVMRTDMDDEEEMRIRLYINCDYDDLAMFMRYKDQFLEGIKNREWRDYQSRYVDSAVYRVNPADRDRFRWY